MSETNTPANAQDATLALKALDDARTTTANSMRPPLWLILICSIALGIKTTAMGVMGTSALWIGLQWGAYITCGLSIAYWLFALKHKEIKVKLVDIKITAPAIISALLICTLIVIARIVFLQTAGLLFPIIAGAINATILAIGLEFGLKSNTKYKEPVND